MIDDVDSSWSDNPSVYKHGQADVSSIQTSYRDSPSCQTNHRGQLVKTGHPLLCINAGRRAIHENYTSLQEAVFNKLSIQDGSQVKLWFAQAQKVKERTFIDVKYLTLVLAEEKKRYAERLETLTLKKCLNNQVFAEISKDFEKLLLCDEFKEENDCAKSKPKGKQKNSPLNISPARLRINTVRVTRHTRHTA